LGVSISLKIELLNKKYKLPIADKLGHQLKMELDQRRIVED
jgi:hypothetical protein